MPRTLRFLFSLVAVALPLALAHCKGDDAAAPSTATASFLVSKNIGPEGGSLEGWGAELKVPAGAVTASTTFTIRRLARPSYGLPEGAEACSDVYSFGPEGATFAQKPVTVRLPYRCQKQASALWSDVSQTRYELTPLTRQEREWVELDVSHFSEGLVSQPSLATPRNDDNGGGGQGGAGSDSLPNAGGSGTAGAGGGAGNGNGNAGTGGTAPANVGGAAGAPVSAGSLCVISTEGETSLCCDPATTYHEIAHCGPTRAGRDEHTTATPGECKALGVARANQCGGNSIVLWLYFGSPTASGLIENNGSALLFRHEKGL